MSKEDGLMELLPPLPAKQEVAPPAAQTPMAMLQKALEAGADVGVLERLMALQEQFEARAARKAFDAAMAKAQTEMRPVARDMDNKQTKSKYASYKALDEALRPIYTKHGFTVSFDTGDTDKPETVRVLAEVTCGGHSKIYHVDIPADGKGAKGGEVMTKTHAFGSALSYGCRYLLRLIFNIAIGESDDDGNAASGGLITEEQRQWLQTLIDETGSDITRFCAFMQVACLADIKAKDYEKAKGALERKGKR